MTEEDQHPAAPAQSSPDEQNDESTDLSLWQVVGSAIAAAIGVQSSANRKRDFSRGKAGHFIAIGIIGTTLFVLAMTLLVRLILSLTAP